MTTNLQSIQPERHVGTLPGDFLVDSNGSGVYTIPIQVPPGTAGLTPSLKVIYNSAAGPDLLGVGWSLHGLSAITRVGATPAQDGFRGTVRYDGRDRFALDGERLMAIRGTYGEPDAVYRTEVDSFRQILPVHEDAAGHGPTGFKVYGREGVCYEYGLTADSRIAAGPGHPAVRVWALSRVVDLSGNFISFSYEQNPANGSYWPQRIDYTGNAGFSPRRAVLFTYEQRPDPILFSVGGYLVRQDRRLTGIETRLDGRSVLSYRFEYRQGQVSDRSLLVAVTQSDADGLSLPPTRFSWSDRDLPVLAPAEQLPSVPPGQALLVPLDVDGDGRRDFVSARPDKHGHLQLDLYLAKQDGTGFKDPVPVATTGLLFGGFLMPLDLNGNGLSDLIYVSNNHGKLGLTAFRATQTAAGWTLVQGPPYAAGPSSLLFGGELVPLDLDGDGRIDLAYATAGEGGKLRLTTLLSDGEQYHVGTVTQTQLELGGRILAMEVNGDGMTDLVYAFVKLGLLELALFLSDGERLVEQQEPLLPPGTALPYGGAPMPLDLTGDGKDDLVYACAGQNGKLVIHTLLATGNRLVPQPPLATPWPYGGLILPAVIRGTGQIDLLVASPNVKGKTHLDWLVWCGDRFAPRPLSLQPLSQVTWGGQIMPLDTRGSGRTDLVFLAQSTTGTLLVRSAAETTPSDLLTELVNGLGGRLSIAYRPLTDPAAYSRSLSTAGEIDPQGLLNTGITGAAWRLAPGGGLAAGSPGATYTSRTVQFAKYVVTAYTESPRPLQAATVRLRYAEARVDLNGRGWLGFRSLEHEELETGCRSVTRYHQRFPLTHRPEEVAALRLSDGTVLQRTTTRYATPGSGPGVFQVLVEEAATQEHTEGKPDVTYRRENRFDEYGNALFSAEIQEPGLPVYTHSRYANDPEQWRLGYLTERRVTADPEGERVLHWERTEFDPVTWKPLTMQRWEDQGQKWLPTTFRYDRFGNLVRRTDPSGASTDFEYDEKLKTFVTRTLQPPNAAGVQLIEETECDPRFGVPVRVVDAGGTLSLRRLDGLGQLVEILAPAPDGALVPVTRSTRGEDDFGIYEEHRRRMDWEGGLWDWSREYLDGAGRWYRKVTPGPGGRDIRIDRELNSQDQPVRESLPYFEGDVPSYVERSYDPLGRPTWIATPADGGQIVLTRLDYLQGGKVVRTEAADTPVARVTVQEFALYHGQRLLVRQIDANKAVTRHRYDPLGRAVETEDPDQVTVEARYDSLDRQVCLTVRRGRKVFSREEVRFDDAAHRVHRTTSAGAETVLQYDPLRRLIRKQAGPLETVLVYDIAAQGALGRLARVDLPGGACYSYAYDPLGRERAVTVSLDGVSYQAESHFGPGGDLLRVTYPDGAVESRRLAPGSHLLSVALAEDAGGPVQEIAAFAEHTALGHPQGIVYGNGARERFTFNERGQIKAQELHLADGSTAAHVRYHWNQLHHLTRLEDVIAPACTQVFQYDSVGRLAVATGAYPEQCFTYDPAGNLTRKGQIDFTYAGYQVTQGDQSGHTVFTAAYDPNGRRVREKLGEKPVCYRYDLAGRLEASGKSAFEYDHTGRRIVKRIEGGPTTWYVLPNYEVTLLPEGGRQHTRYVAGPRGPIAAVTRADEGTIPAPGTHPGVPAIGTLYYHKNHLDHTTAVTDTEGRIFARVEYLPFGEIHELTGPDAFRHKFGGKELDLDTGLYYFESRYYDPRTGRFLTPDDRLGGALEQSGSLNRYAYALNNPVSFMDPTGHNAVSDWFQRNWQRVAGIAGGLALAAAGAALGLAAGFVAAGTFGGASLLAFGMTVLGSTLVGAGISAAWYALNASEQTFAWSQYGTELGLGALFGFVSGLAAGAATVAAVPASSLASMTWSQWFKEMARQTLIYTAAYVVGYAAGGGVEQMVRNAINGRPWQEGVAESVGWSTLKGLGWGVSTPLFFLAGAAVRPLAGMLGNWVRGLRGQGAPQPGAAPASAAAEYRQRGGLYESFEAGVEAVQPRIALAT